MVPGTPNPAVRTALPAVLLVMFLGALDQTVMASALSTIAGELHALDRMPAILTAYLAAATAGMPLTGKLGDRYGRKRVLTGSLLLFIVGAALSGAAQSLGELMAFRAVQGLGGGGLMIGAQSVIGELVSPRERGRFLGYVGAAYLFAIVAGPLAGGAIVDNFSWRWIFYAYLPLGTLALVLVSRSLRLPPPEAGPGVDYAGAALLSLAIVAVVLLSTRAIYAGPGWLPPLLWATAALAVGGWLAASRHASDPIISPALFRDPAFTIPAAISFLIGFALFAAVSFLPAFLQISLGISATASGLMLIALMGGLLVTTVLSGGLIRRSGRYRGYPILGTALAAAGMVLFSMLSAASGIPAVLLAAVLLGLGVGLVMQVMILVVQNAVEQRNLGSATAVVIFLRQMGSTLGVSLLGSLIATRFAANVPAGLAGRLGDDLNSLTPRAMDGLPAADRAAVGAAFGSALPPVFRYAAALLAVAFVLALFLPYRELRTTAYADAAGAGTGTVPAPATGPAASPATGAGPDVARGTARGSGPDQADSGGNSGPPDPGKEGRSS